MTGKPSGQAGASPAPDRSVLTTSMPVTRKRSVSYTYERNEIRPYRLRDGWSLDSQQAIRVARALRKVHLANLRRLYRPLRRVPLRAR